MPAEERKSRAQFVPREAGIHRTLYMSMLQLYSRTALWLCLILNFAYRMPEVFYLYDTITVDVRNERCILFVSPAQKIEKLYISLFWPESILAFIHLCFWFNKGNQYLATTTTTTKQKKNVFLYISYSSSGCDVGLIHNRAPERGQPTTMSALQCSYSKV